MPVTHLLHEIREPGCTGGANLLVRCLNHRRRQHPRQADHAADAETLTAVLAVPRPLPPVTVRRGRGVLVSSWDQGLFGQLIVNWLRLAVPGVPLCALKNIPASCVLFAPLRVAVPTVVHVVPLAE